MSAISRSENARAECGKPRLVGINHIAIEVGDIDRALAFYGKIFDFGLRAKRPGNAFIELGDQFINLIQSGEEHPERPGIGAGISGSWSMIARRSARLSRRRAASCCPGRFSISSTHGATGSRSSSTATSSSPRRHISWPRWVSTPARATKRSASLPTRA